MKKEQGLYFSYFCYFLGEHYLYTIKFEKLHKWAYIGTVNRMEKLFSVNILYFSSIQGKLIYPELDSNWTFFM